VAHLTAGCSTVELSRNACPNDAFIVPYPGIIVNTFLMIGSTKKRILLANPSNSARLRAFFGDSLAQRALKNEVRQQHRLLPESPYQARYRKVDTGPS
jgi:hypothetical protein